MVSVPSASFVTGGGDYLLAVKENQGHLFEDIHCLFEVDVAHGIDKAQHSHAQTVNKGHGRLEIRECWATEKEEYLALVRKNQNWKGLRSVVRIVSQRKFIKILLSCNRVTFFNV